MTISEQKTVDVAKLASLALSPEEITGFSEQMSGILTYVEQLNRLDTSRIEPTSHVIPLSNVFREDGTVPSLSVEEALQNAPDASLPFFRVPKIIEEGR